MLGRANSHPGKARIKGAAFLLLVWSGVWTVPAFSQNASLASSLNLREIQLTGEGQETRVSIQFSRPPNGIKSFALASPPRIVIDVKGPTRGLPSVSYPAQDEIITQVRVGYHKQSIRFVLDLRVEAIPTFSAKQDETDETIVNVVLGRQGKISERAAIQVLFSQTGKRTIKRTIKRTAVAKKTAPGPQARHKTVVQAPARMPTPSRPKTAAAPGVLLPEVAPSLDARKVEIMPARAPEPVGESQTQLATQPQAAPPKPSQAATPLEFPGTSFPPERKPSASRTPKGVPSSPLQYSLLTQPNKTASTWSAPPQSSLLDSSPRSKATPSVPSQALVEGPRIAALPPQSGSARSARSEPFTRPSAPPPAAATPSLSPEKPRSPNSLSREVRRHLGKGQILYDQGSIDEAIVEWRQTAHLAPHNAKVHHLLGLALQDRGDQNEAIMELNTSLRLDPENATAYVHLAQALEAQGDVQGARTAYTKALKLVPTSAHVHNRLGHLLASQEDWQGAAKEWQQTTKLQPDYAYAYANLGEALERIEKKKAALEAYRQAVSLDPGAPFVAEVNQRITRLSAYGF